ncbi:MAG: hypothetical protein ACK42C_06525 [Aquificaceae bacterium]|jgi:predicted nucleotidyltransferase|uniref:hypothetical protein n=1 Tax=Hydrogenobacter sp. Uz 6-8 TaxID=3384828 RepID=UPI0030A6BF2E
MEGRVRLSEKTLRSIRETAEEVFGKEVEVYLFGSRTDPAERGGDIDLLIKAPMKVVPYPEGEEEKPIHRIALEEGVRL